MAHVLIYAMNYAPEVAGVGRYTGEIGDHFVESGQEVTVVTTIPHYPGWKALPPYRNGRYRTEWRCGAKIIRCPLILRERMGGIWRFLAPWSFAASSAPIAFWQILRHRPDTVICIEPTLMAAPIALLAAKLVGARTVLHVQDLEVDAGFAVSHLTQAAWVKRLAFACERALLRRFDRLITISGRMAERLVGKGVSVDRVSVVRNWVDIDHIKPCDCASPYRKELGIAASDCVALYSGNLGAKQGLCDVIEAARLLEARGDVKFVIAGEGPAKPALVESAANLPNVRFLPFQPYARLSEFLSVADLHILPQAADAADLVLPSKLGGMLASGRRIVVTAAPDTELANFLAGAAILTPPENARALATAIESAADDRSDDAQGRAARRALAGQLAKADSLKRFEALAMRRDPVSSPVREAPPAPRAAVERVRESVG